jgi:hypothetical protein
MTSQSQQTGATLPKGQQDSSRPVWFAITAVLVFGALTAAAVLASGFSAGPVAAAALIGCAGAAMVTCIAVPFSGTKFQIVSTTLEMSGIALLLACVAGAVVAGVAWIVAQ